MEKKECTKCGEVLSLGSFSKNAKAKDGLQYTCKDCDAEYWRLKPKKAKAHTVYCITHTGDVVYVGYTANFHQRKIEHLSLARHHRFAQSTLYGFMNENECEINIVATFDTKDEALEYEESTTIYHHEQGATLHNVEYLEQDDCEYDDYTGEKVREEYSPSNGVYN